MFSKTERGLVKYECKLSVYSSVERFLWFLFKWNTEQFGFKDMHYAWHSCVLNFFQHVLISVLFYSLRRSDICFQLFQEAVFCGFFFELDLIFFCVKSLFGGTWFSLSILHLFPWFCDAGFLNFEMYFELVFLRISMFLLINIFWNAASMLFLPLVANSWFMNPTDLSSMRLCTLFGLVKFHSISIRNLQKFTSNLHPGGDQMQIMLLFGQKSHSPNREGIAWEDVLFLFCIIGCRVMS